MVLNFIIISKHINIAGSALSEYSRVRNPDAEAICDLAMYNYIEVPVYLTCLCK